MSTHQSFFSSYGVFRPGGGPILLPSSDLDGDQIDDLAIRASDGGPLRALHFLLSAARRRPDLARP